MKKKRKGQFGAFVSFMVLMLVVFGGFINVLNFKDTVEKEVRVNFDDTEAVSRASTYGTYYQANFVPQSFKLSEQRTAYVRGKEANFLDWEKDSVSSVSQSDIEQRLKDNLGEYIIQDFGTNYFHKSNEISCEIKGDYTFSVDKHLFKINPVGFGSSTPEEDDKRAPRIECSSSSAEATYYLKDQISSNATRSYITVNASKYFANKLKNKIRNKTYSETYKLEESECKYEGFKEDKEENLKNDVKTAVEINVSSAFTQSSFQFNTDGSSQFNTEGLGEKKGLEVSKASGATCPVEGCSYYVEQIEEEGETITSCISLGNDAECEGPVSNPHIEVKGELEEDSLSDDNEDDDCEEGEFFVSAFKYTFTAEEVGVGYKMADTRESVLTRKGEKNLVFNSEYTHELEQQENPIP